MYILKCLDIIQELIINQMEVVTFKVPSGKDLYKQTIVISKDDTFPARFLNLFDNYPLGQNTRMKNFIGLISAVLVGLMIIFAQIQ